MDSFCQIWIHYIFATKGRKPYFEDTQIRKEAHTYMANTAWTNGSYVKNIGGVADHVHLLCSLPKTLTIGGLIKEIKRTSSDWIKGRFPSLQNFYWQKGYGAFSVSQSGLRVVGKYIENQEAHHQRQNFETEFREFLKKYEINYEERHLKN